MVERVHDSNQEPPFAHPSGSDVGAQIDRVPARRPPLMTVGGQIQRRFAHRIFVRKVLHLLLLLVRFTVNGHEVRRELERGHGHLVRRLAVAVVAHAAVRYFAAVHADLLDVVDVRLRFVQLRLVVAVDLLLDELAGAAQAAGAGRATSLLDGAAAGRRRRHHHRRTAHRVVRMVEVRYGDVVAAVAVARGRRKRARGVLLLARRVQLRVAARVTLRLFGFVC